jgi:acyl-CoA reductase-like NAD-dependent aldehyde dehydrogenase
VARLPECGQVSIGSHGSGLRPDVPFGGHRHSGVGVENGIRGLEEFSQVQALIRPA